jgi:hypothetical protein
VSNQNDNHRTGCGCQECTGIIGGKGEQAADHDLEQLRNELRDCERANESLREGMRTTVAEKNALKAELDQMLRLAAGHG